MADMEAVARSRQERLKAMRAEAQTTDAQGGAEDDSARKRARDETEEPVIKFRNYTPADTELQAAVMPKPELPSAEEVVKEHLAHEPTKPVIDSVDLASLAPRKVDWDLKRDIAKKLEKLERRTQRAIVQIIREQHADLIATGDMDGGDED